VKVVAKKTKKKSFLSPQYSHATIGDSRRVAGLINVLFRNRTVLVDFLAHKSRFQQKRGPKGKRLEGGVAR
jgi:hypothetical protein